MLDPASEGVGRAVAVAMLVEEWIGNPGRGVAMAAAKAACAEASGPRRIRVES